MSSIYPFQWHDLTVRSPDDISEAINTIESTDMGVLFIRRLANHIGLKYSIECLRHACFLVIKIDEGVNPHIIQAVIELYQ